MAKLDADRAASTRLEASRSSILSGNSCSADGTSIFHAASNTMDSTTCRPPRLDTQGSLPDDVSSIPATRGAHRGLDLPLRPVLLELPQEVLENVFDSLRSHPFYTNSGLLESKGPVENIKNLRLTCRALRDRSSHLLVERVTVSMQPESVQRLIDITAHPLISRGVRTVEVSLASYCKETAFNFDVFRDHLSQQFLRLAPFFPEEESEPLEWKDWRRRVADINGADSDLVAEVMARFILLGPPSPSTEIDTNHQTSQSREVRAAYAVIDDTAKTPVASIKQLVRVAHCCYWEAWAKQDRLASDGTFVRAIVAALKLPKIRRLEVHYDYEQPPNYTPIFRQAVNSVPFLEEVIPDALLDVFTRDDLCLPFSWHTKRLHITGNNLDDPWLSQNPSLHDIPMLILLECQKQAASEGVALKLQHVDFNLPYQHRFFSPPNAEEAEQLGGIGKSLLTFTLRLAGIRVCDLQDELSPDDPRSASTMFTALLQNSDSLESLSVRMYHDQGDPRHLINFARLWPIVQLRTWPKLKYVDLLGWDYDFVDLSTLFESVTKPISIHLHQLRLCTGNWAEVLDLLRGKGDKSTGCRAYGKSSWKELPHEFGVSTGNYRAQLAQFMTHNAFVKLYGDDNAAERYIKGLLMHNPLRG